MQMSQNVHDESLLFNKHKLIKIIKVHFLKFVPKQHAISMSQHVHAEALVFKKALEYFKIINGHFLIFKNFVIQTSPNVHVVARVFKKGIKLIKNVQLCNFHSKNMQF